MEEFKPKGKFYKHIKTGSIVMAMNNGRKCGIQCNRCIHKKQVLGIIAASTNISWPLLSVFWFCGIGSGTFEEVENLG